MRDDALRTQFTTFKAGLAIGVAGLLATGAGTLADAYWAVLSGSVATSLGLVTVACALVSAEAITGTRTDP